MSKVSNISKGLIIIEQYEEDAVFTAEHDQIWCGQGNGKSVNEITEEGKQLMESLGWFVDVALGCWSIML